MAHVVLSKAEHEEWTRSRRSAPFQSPAGSPVQVLLAWRSLNAYGVDARAIVRAFARGNSGALMVKKVVNVFDYTRTLSENVGADIQEVRFVLETDRHDRDHRDEDRGRDVCRFGTLRQTRGGSVMVMDLADADAAFSDGDEDDILAFDRGEIQDGNPFAFPVESSRVGWRGRR